MQFNFENVDTSNFVCIQMKDASVYYGEVAWIDEKGLMTEEPQNPEETPNIKRVRHGVGVQLFASSDDSVLCKYEGHWEKDRKNGTGICTFPDKSIYNGNMKNDIRDGYGKFTWGNGDSYEGNWKEGRMEGGGKFIHHQVSRRREAKEIINGIRQEELGMIHTGVFKNNYFHYQYAQGDGIFISPFSNKDELFIIEKRQKDIVLAKETTKKDKQFIFERTNDFEKIAELIKKSNSNKRIPVILPSREWQNSKKDFYSNLSQASKKEVFEFDLRMAAEMKKNEDQYHNFQRKTKNDLARALAKGEVFSINIDDTSIKYDEVYDPDLKEFYDPEVLPSQIFNIDELNKFEVSDKVLMNSEFRTMRAGTEYNLIVWSKFKISNEIEPKKMLEKFERRFSNLLPILKLDLIVLV